MGLTTKLLRDWMRAKRKAALAELQPSQPIISMADLPREGARWRRNPDGSWMRWSYLGNDWEPNEAPEGLVEAASARLAENEWTLETSGEWVPWREHEKPPAETASTVEPVPESPPPAPRADDQPPPQWTDPWKPEWNQDFK